MNIWEECAAEGGNDGMDYLFSGGLFKFTEKGKTFLASNNGFYQDDNGVNKGAFDIYTGEGHTKERKLNNKADVQTFSPSLGVLNGDKSVIMTSWEARRQYVRVLNNRTLVRNVLYTSSLKKLGFSHDRELKMALPNILKPVYPNVAEAVEAVLSGECIAKAFNNKYFLANSMYSDNIVLGYKEYEIGEYDAATKVITLYEQFQDKEMEVSKYFRV